MQEVRCCLFCGRDTRSRCQICSRCLGEDDGHQESEPERPWPQQIGEDDYSEDSDADSVCKPDGFSFCLSLAP